MVKQAEKQIQQTNVGSVAKKVKAPFLRRPLITIAWSRFNSHPHQTRCCVLG